MLKNTINACDEQSEPTAGGNKLTFTEARLPANYAPRHAGKEWYRDSDGNLDKTDFTAPRMLVWREVEVTATPEALHAYLTEASKRTDAFVVRGALSDRTRRKPSVSDPNWTFGGKVAPRLLTAGHGDAGSLDDEPRSWCCIDLDNATLPEGFDFLADTAGAVQWVTRNLLPPEFAGVSVVYQLSSSAGVKGDPREVKAHLWYVLDRPIDGATMREWAKGWNMESGGKVVDPQVFVPTQPHYTAPPMFSDGVTDPFPDPADRVGLVRGDRDQVALRVPDQAEREAAAKRKRDAADQDRATAGYKGKATAPVLDDGLIRFGPGYRGWLAGIGYGGSIRDYFLKAAAAYFAQHGAAGDADALMREVQDAVNNSPWLDCGEPWSRPRSDAQRYIDSGNVAELVRDIKRREARAEAERRNAADCPHPEFGGTLDEAQRKVEAVVSDFFDRIVPEARTARDQNDVAVDDWIARYQDGSADGDPEHAVREFSGALTSDDLFEGTSAAGGGGRPPVPLYEPPQIGLRVTAGVGKTRAVLHQIVEAAKRGLNVAYFAPTHQLLDEVGARLDQIGGAGLWQVYRGRNALDPEVNDGETPMCRQTPIVGEVERLGGNIADVCRVCPFSPQNANDGPICGVMRQRSVEARIWLMPTNLLQNRRQGAVPKPDAVVIDEAAWDRFARLIDDPFNPFEMVDDGLPADRTTEAERAAYKSALDKLKAGLPDAAAGRGPMLVKPFQEAGLTADKAAYAAELEWRRLDATIDRETYRAAIREAIDTGDKDALKRLQATATTGTVRRARALWLGIATALAQGEDRSARVFVQGQNKVVFQNRHDLDGDWVGGEAPMRRRDGRWVVELPDDGSRGAPVLYLDATMTPDVVRWWLPRLEVHEARAEAPHALRLLVHDFVGSAKKIDPTNERVKGHEPTLKAAHNHVERMADVIEVAARMHQGRGDQFDVAVIAPKGTVKTLESEYGARLGDRVDFMHFGDLRGIDRHGRTPIAFVFGRPLPPVAALEREAMALTGRMPRRLRHDQPLPMKPVRARMAEGCEPVVADAEHHPDPDVQAVFESKVVAELEQAEGRLRAVQRGADNPALIVMATSTAAACDLTFHRALSWDELMECGGPVGWMKVWGLDTERPLDIGRMFFPDAADHRQAGSDWKRRAPGAALRWLGAGNPWQISRERFPLEICHGSTPPEPPYRVRFEGDKKSGLFRIDAAKHATDPERRAALERYVGLTVADLTAADAAPTRRRPKKVASATATDPAAPSNTTATTTSGDQPAADTSSTGGEHQPTAATTTTEKNVDNTKVEMADVLAALGIPRAEYKRLAKRAAKRRGVAGRYSAGRASRDDLAAIDMAVWQTVLARPDVDVAAAKATVRRVAAERAAVAA